jgi:D-3-phosphoglycerate dehydrogenase
MVRAIGIAAREEIRVMKVAVLDDWERVAADCADWSALRAQAEVVFRHAPFASESEAAAWLADFPIILAVRERTPFPRALVKRLPQLRMFGLTGKRARLVDVDALREQGVTVCYTGGGDSGVSTAELTLGLMLAAARRIPTGDAAIRAGQFAEGAAAGFELRGKTLGLIGLGRIGSLVAGFGKALGMKVIAWSPNLTAERAADAGVELSAKDVLFATADIVSLHLVLSDRSRGVIGRDDIARMKPGALLVNTSRALLVDQAALIEAIAAQRIFAALDVYDQEPLPAGHPLRALPNAVLTPHLGYGTVETFRDYYSQGVENALAFLAGKPIRVLTD